MSEAAVNLSPEQRIANFLTPESEAPEPAPSSEPEEYYEAAEAPQENLREAPPETQAEYEEPEGQEIEEWNQLAEYLEADPGDLYNLKVSLDTPDGPEKVTIEQLKDTYRENLKYQREAQQLEITRQQAAAQIQQAAQALQAKEQQAAELLNYVESNFYQEMGRVNWDQLRQTNPAEYAALRLQYQERQNQLANLKAQAAVRWEQAQREQAQRADLYERELLQREARLLQSAVPEWNDPVVAEREKQEIASFLLNRGFSPEEVAGLKLHKQVLLARDAMRYQRSKGEAAKNKVFKLGKKVLSPGARTSRADQTSNDTRRLRSSLKKSGNYKDAAVLISKLMS